MERTQLKAQALIHDDAGHVEKYVHLGEQLRKVLHIIRNMVVNHKGRKEHLMLAASKNPTE